MTIHIKGLNLTFFTKCFKCFILLLRFSPCTKATKNISIWGDTRYFVARYKQSYFGHISLTSTQYRINVRKCYFNEEPEHWIVSANQRQNYSLLTLSMTGKRVDCLATIFRLSHNLDKNLFLKRNVMKSNLFQSAHPYGNLEHERKSEFPRLTSVWCFHQNNCRTQFFPLWRCQHIFCTFW